MADLIDIRPHLDRQRPKLPLDPFAALVHALRIAPLPTLVESLAAARTLPELVNLIDGLAGVVIHRTAPRCKLLRHLKAADTDGTHHEGE